MSTDFDVHAVESSEIVEGIAAMLSIPILLPLASAVNQPLVKSILKEGIAFAERCKEAAADARERLEDTIAEAQAEVEAEQRQSDNQDPSSTGRGVLVQREPSRHLNFGGPSSQAATQLQNTMQELDAQVRWLTNDLFDLRILVSMGLGTLALRQLFARGTRWDEMPWYVLAWYAVDTFVKFDPDPDGAQSHAQHPSTITVESSSESS